MKGERTFDRHIAEWINTRREQLGTTEDDRYISIENCGRIRRELVECGRLIEVLAVEHYRREHVWRTQGTSRSSCMTRSNRSTLRSETSRRPIRPRRRRTPQEVHGPAGAQVCGEWFPALAQMAPSQPQDLPQRGLPPCIIAGALAGSVALGLAGQLQQRDHVTCRDGRACFEAFVAAPEREGGQVG
jgi:hypothetical protein